MDRWIRRIDTVLILCMICYVVLFACPRFAGVRPVRVLSGSMAPKIQEGDMAYIKSCTASDARPGDVIAFRLENGQMVLHRLIEKTGEGLITKGDANEREDFCPADPEQVVGRLVFSLPQGALWYERATSEQVIKALFLYGIIRGCRTLIRRFHRRFSR